MKGLLQKYQKLDRSEPPTSQNNHPHDQGNQRSNKRPRIEKKIVDFLIIGAQKAGTTALAKNLNKHPDIYVKNECQFFTFCWGYGVDWYRQQLQSPKPIIGEKTPEIIYCDDCATRVAEICPNAKFILCLRDPIKRAYSSWNMEIQTKRESLSFSDCVDRELRTMMNERRTYGTAEYHFIQRGFYMDQVERFQAVFPNKEQMLIVIAERLHHSPAEEYTRIMEFLGTRNFTFIPEDDNVGEYKIPEMNEKMKQKLREIYAPHNQRLYQYLGIGSLPEWEEDYIAPPIPAESVTTSAREGFIVNHLPSLCPIVPLEDPASGHSPIEGTTFSSTLQITSDEGDFATYGTQTGTDKITHHGYHRYYPLYLERFRAITEPWSMLEIGTDQSRSMEMWKKYFPSNVFIYGIDIGVSAQGERFQIFQADQSKTADLQRVIRSIQTPSSPSTAAPPTHFIIDDGSHIPEHQISTFNLLFSSLLTPGGVYIIEDIETSYWTRGGLYGYTTEYGYHNSRSLIEIFKDLLDDVNQEFLTFRNREKQNQCLDSIVSRETRESIGSITFGQNCIVIIKKTRDEMERYNGREYRYKRHL